MRPKLLSIQGLHSFLEEQNIDFDVLCEKGLFGIFGPTGSGKSTILDGITLAMYGRIARESKTFINTNVNVCFVRFTFSIGGAKRRLYQVERRFRRDAKTGNSRNDTALLVEWIGEDTEVIASDVRGVNEKCEALLGLGLDDFTRTVVLPQGKFSEFLTLEGKQRRDMLERLFHLEQYGNELTSRLSRHSNEVKEQRSHLEGQLMNYAGDTKEAIKEKQAMHNQKQTSLVQYREELAVLQKQIDEAIQVVQWSDEKIGLQTKLTDLINYEPAMQQARNRYHLALKCANILPYVKQKQQDEQMYHINQSKFTNVQSTWSALSQEKKEKEDKAALAAQRKEKELPALQIALHEIDVVIKNIAIREDWKQQLTSARQTQEQTKLKLLEMTALHSKQQEDIEAQKKSIRETEAKRMENIVSAQWREQVTTALHLDEKQCEYEVAMQTVQNSIDALLQAQALDEKTIYDVSEKKKIEQEAVFLLQQDLKQSQSELPKQEDISLLFEQLLRIRDTHERLTLKQASLDELVMKMQQEQTSLTNKTEQLQTMQAALQHIEKTFQQYENAELIARLREELQEGMPCQVCGSVVHTAVHQTSSMQETEYLQLLAQKENLEQHVMQRTREIDAAQVRLHDGKQQEEVLRQEMKSLKVLLEHDPLDRLEKTYQDLLAKQNELTERIQILSAALREKETQVVEMDKQMIVLETSLQARKTQCIGLQKQREEYQSAMKTIQIERARLPLHAEQLQLQLKEIQTKDAVYQQCEQALTMQRAELDRSSEDMIHFNSQLDSLQKEQAMLDRDIHHWTLRCKQLEEEIDRKLPVGIQPIDEQQRLQNTITEIQTMYSLAQEQHLAVTKEYEAQNEALVALTSVLQENRASLDRSAAILQNQMRKEGIIDEATIVDGALDGEEIEALKVLIEEHEQQLSQVKTLLQRVEESLNGRKIEHTELQAWITRQDELQQEIELMQDAVSKLDGEIIKTKANLIVKQELMEKQREVNKRYGMLVDLEKLFRGKKFVEYAALSQLRYIAGIANERLRDITNGMMGLEIDETGVFLIRDYKNGGVAREVGTLSGGETFLASLSLALALSAQIQLKGNSPLELFFLDEGFGTLDENYLDVVLSSLESIHHESLKIGLISHVESIKERMPIKLLVTPSRSGEGGSRVHIELT